MENPWLHRYAVLIAVSTALLFITGPAVSSNEARPLYSLGQGHVWLGAAVAILMAGLVIWLWRLNERPWLRRLAWAALGANIVQDLLWIETGPLPAPVRITHALLGQLFFSTTVAIAVFTSKSWSQSPKQAENASLLRFLATTAPALVLLQVILGTAFRHGVMGSMPHILGALVAAALLGPTMAVQHPGVRPAGIVLALAASVQILLGFALLTMESLEMDPLAVVVVTVAHAAMGACTLAAAVGMSILIWRVLRVAALHKTGESALPLASQELGSHEPPPSPP